MRRVHLGEVDARGLYREQAFGSMFDYCVQALHLSEAEAYLRIRAARLGRQFPRVLPMMASGELHLSAVKLLSPVLTPANADELLAQASGTSYGASTVTLRYRRRFRERFREREREHVGRL